MTNVALVNMMSLLFFLLGLALIITVPFVPDDHLLIQGIVLLSGCGHIFAMVGCFIVRDALKEEVISG